MGNSRGGVAERTRAASREYNYGLALLKAWLCLEVVACHFWSPVGNDLKMLQAFRMVAVPGFLMISFYFVARHVFDGDFKWLKDRIRKLLVPYFAWPLICFLIVYAGVRLSLLTAKGSFGWKNLGWQYLVGCDFSILPPMWYLYDLIIWMVFFTCAFYVVRAEKIRVVMLLLAGLASFWFQYSGVNFKLFNQLDLRAAYTFGRIAETAPYVVFGLLWGELRPKLPSKTHFAFAFAGITLIVASVISYLPKQNGFGYQGVALLLRSIGVVLFFDGLSWISEFRIVNRIIRFLAHYCMGVFCCHVIVGRLLKFGLPHLPVARESFGLSVLIWGLSIVICWMLARVPSRIFREMTE